MTSPDTALTRLIYCSRQAPTLASTLDQVIEDILTISVAMNRAADITGVLLFHDGWFIQALEGPADAVAATYGRIIADRRHTQVTRLSTEVIGRREFGEWAMCARSLSTADAGMLDMVAITPPSHLPGLAPQEALWMLKVVAAMKV